MSYYSTIGRTLDIRDSCEVRGESRRRGVGLTRPRDDLNVFANDSSANTHTPRSGIQCVPQQHKSLSNNNILTNPSSDVKLERNHIHRTAQQTSIESEYRPLPRKLLHSKINESHVPLPGSGRQQEQPSVVTAAPTTPRGTTRGTTRGRVHQDSGIFDFGQNQVASAAYKAAPVSRRASVTPSFTERPHRGGVRSPWVGFTDIQDKEYLKRS
eukprot:PhF_6_TR13314/c0_g1_i1/m.21095